MRAFQKLILAGLLPAAIVLTGCEQKTTRKVTVEGPDKKVEVKVEKTEKK